MVPAWDDVLCPVLVAIGERWAATGEGVEVEHLLAETAIGVLRGGQPAPRSRATAARCCSPARRASCTACRCPRWPPRWPSTGIGVRLLGGSLPAGALRGGGPADRAGRADGVGAAAGARGRRVLERLPLLRPPVAVLAGGIGWLGRPLPARVTYASDLAAAVALIGRAVGG